MFRYVVLCGLSVAAVSGAWAQGSSSGGMSAQQRTETGAPVDKQTMSFIRQAAEGGRFEITSSEIAEQRASNPEVKTFAKRMIQDHTEVDKQLKSAASQAGASVPQVTLQKKHADIVAELKKQSGAAFDRTYSDAQVTAHQETIELFDDYAKKGDNAQLKTFATTALPKLRQHLELAKDLKQTVAGAATGGASGTSGTKGQSGKGSTPK